MTYLRQSGETGGNANDPYTGQDRFDRITDIRWLRSNDPNTPAEHVDRIQYGFDHAGNRLWRRNAVAGSHWDELYTYDELAQLLRRRRGTLNGSHDDLTETPLDDEVFTYDPTGNWQRYERTIEGEPVFDQTRTHNPANEIETMTGSADLLRHDRAGNMYRIPRPADWNQAYALKWDAWNRLVGVYVPPFVNPILHPEATAPGLLYVAYAYDGLARRISKSTPAAGTGRRHFYYSDQWQVLEERVEGHDGAERQFVWGQRYRDDLILRETFPEPEPEPLSSSSSTEDPPPPVPTRLYATHDQWHVIAAVDEFGQVAERYAYRAFGETLFLGESFQDLGGSQLGWETTYGAYRYDVETQLYAVRYRYLHPTLGRWVSRDPFGFLGGENFFAYVRNRGTHRVDPLGLCDVSAKDFLKNLRQQIDGGTLGLDELFKNSLQFYRNSDPNSDWICDCQDCMEELFDAWRDLFGRSYHDLSKEDKDRWMAVRGRSMFGAAAWDKFQHFIAEAGIAATSGETVADAFGIGVELLDVAIFAWGYITGTRKPHQEGWSGRDLEWGFAGSDFENKFDTWLDTDCRDFVDTFVNGKQKLSDFFPP